MIQIVKEQKNNHAQFNYELAVQMKMELIENLDGYTRFEKYVQRWIDDHCGDSLNGIAARVYLDKIIEMSDEELVVWFKNSNWHKNTLY